MDTHGEEGESVGYEATGLNPHYKPPIMRWNTVEIEAPAGTAFAVTCDSCGVLGIRLACKHDALVEHNLPKGAEIVTIGEGEGAFVVRNDERGPAREHEFEPDGTPERRCRVCLAEV